MSRITDGKIIKEIESEPLRVGDKTSMSPRLEAFFSFKTCPVRRSLFNSIGRGGEEVCIKFIKDNDHLGFAEFSAILNMWKIDDCTLSKTNNKIWALLTECNGVMYVPRNRRKNV